MQLEFEGVSKAFFSKRGRLAVLDDLCCTVAPGEILALLGPNGTGKTTTINLALGLLRPDKGTIRVGGEARGNITPHFRRRVGYLPEERTLLRKIQIKEQLQLLGRLRGVGDSAIAGRLSELAAVLCVEHLLSEIPEKVSKGNIQRLCIIGALINEPELLILDEPFSGLDPVGVQLLRSLLIERRKQGCAVVVSTHRMEEAQRLCDRAVFIKGGKAIPLDQLVLKPDLATARRWRIRCQGDLSALRSVAALEYRGLDVIVTLHAGRGIGEVVDEITIRQIPLTAIEAYLPSLEEAYVSLSQQREEL